jgi:hypothetical protein
MISRFWQKKWGICFFLVLVAFAVFYRLSGYDFVNFDDDLYVTANFRIQSGLTLKNIEWAFSATEIANWHPVTWISHMLDVQLWGLDSGRHHHCQYIIIVSDSESYDGSFVAQRLCGRSVCNSPP